MNQTRSNAEVFCGLLYAALKHDEEEINEIRKKRVSDGPPEHFLVSVAHAGELAIQYLVRKQALRDRIALESEVRCEQRKGHIDLCLVGDGNYRASLELKPPCSLFEPQSIRSLKRDVKRGLTRSVRGVQSCQQYHGWLLITSEPKDALPFVQQAVRGLAKVADYSASEPIPINSDQPHKYSGKNLYVVVFSIRAQHEKVATSVAR